MSKLPRRHRSFEKIKVADLARLSKLASDDLKDYFARRPDSPYVDRLMLLCLCQGGAEHYVYGERGVADFDVWAFFRTHRSGPFPTRGRRGRADFGSSRFGRTQEAGCAGRRVDVLGMSMPVRKGLSAVEALKSLLGSAPHGGSAWYLAQCPVVAIWPASIRGKVIWNAPPRRCIKLAGHFGKRRGA